MKQTQKVQEARIRNYEELIKEYEDFDSILFGDNIKRLKKELEDIKKLNKYV